MKKGDSWKERGAKERKDVVWREDYERRGEKRRGGEEEVRLGRDLTLLERNSKRERREKRREIGKRGYEVGFVCTMAEIGCNWARIGPSKSSQSLSIAHKWAVEID
ncbi:hypothetical protein Tco_0751555 [Tanacetum coccineum]|uniref:Uncharacterized protein n=1 Tax=Tanacetum coccineum TaxID=301880 RepID=A0ABQ4Z4D0_9ASTR